MQKALAPDISTWPGDNPQLIGSACACCGATAFPVQQRCPRCSVGEMSRVLLPRRGTLVAWTTQDDVIRVEGRLTENDPANLQFGMEVELTMVPFTTDDDGDEIVPFAFQPI